VSVEGQVAEINPASHQAMPGQAIFTAENAEKIGHATRGKIFISRETLRNEQKSD
jgi:hypothetical protein